MNVPIGCGGLLVVPDDVVVGDAEGVVVMPAAVVDEVASAAAEQDAMEEFVWGRVNQGEAITGLYPPDAETRARFDRQRGA
jgi:regulator of RNase E activity RraA